MHDTATRATIAAVAQQLRPFLEARFRDWKIERGCTDPLPSTGMCRFATAFLTLALPRAGIAAPARPRQGCARYHPADPGVLSRFQDMPGGFRDAAGSWHDHLWLEVQAREGATIVDLTADQFADAPIIVQPADDPRYRANWRQDYTRRHIKDVLPRARQWLARLDALSIPEHVR